MPRLHTSGILTVMNERLRGAPSRHKRGTYRKVGGGDSSVLDRIRERRAKEAKKPPRVTEHRIEPKKHKFFTELALRYREYMRLHVDQMERDQRFNHTQRVHTPSGITIDRVGRWGDPTEHCLVEAAVAEILADMVKLPEDQKRLLVAAALVHDWRKKGEVEETRYVTDPKVIEGSYQKSKEGIRDSGVEQARAVASLTESVAHTSLPQFAQVNLPDRSISLREGTPLVDMIMHYIDDITRGTDLVSLDVRMDALDKAAQEGRYAYNNEGKAVWGGRAYFQAQREIGHLIEQKIVEQLGDEERAKIGDPKNLPNVLKKKLVERIEAS